MIAVAFGQRLEPRALDALRKAARISRSGDQGLAHLHLDLARLTHLPDPQALDARLTRARRLLDDGTPPDILLAKSSSLDSLASFFAKYDADQPRVPSGSGRESGRWTRDGSSIEGSVSYATTALAIPAARAAPLFAPDIGAAALAALSSLFAAVGAAATLGVLFVPWQNGTSSAGALPGSSGASYQFDHDTGVLRVLGATGSLLAVGQLGQGGVFRDVYTGVPFARAIDGAVVFNEDVTRPSARATSGTDARARAKEDTNKPKLCPAPGKDQPGYAKPRARAYQEQIAFLINGLKGLKYGLAINLFNPVTGRIVHFDECIRRSGRLVDAKGPGYDRLLRYKPDRIERSWLNQSERQVQAAGHRRIVWYFAESGAASHARELFRKHDEGRQFIIIRHVPAVWK